MAPKSCQVCARPGMVFEDHDHFTNKFRGWLCNSCNVTLSNYNDSVLSLRSKADQEKVFCEHNLPNLQGPELYAKYLKAQLDLRMVKVDILNALARYLEQHLTT